MGGAHVYDLTPETTHLIVCDHHSEEARRKDPDGDGPGRKYRWVAKLRPDVRPMAAGWVGAVCDLWKNDEPIDFAALEEQWTLKPLEKEGGVVDPETGEEGPRPHLLCSITGFEDRKLVLEAPVARALCLTLAPISSRRATATRGYNQRKRRDLYGRPD
jgi:DNA replication regulator DPB11